MRLVFNLMHILFKKILTDGKNHCQLESTLHFMATTYKDDVIKSFQCSSKVPFYKSLKKR